MLPQQAVSFVLKGGKLELPENCNHTIQRVFMSCLADNAVERPDFQVICDDLENL